LLSAAPLFKQALLRSPSLSPAGSGALPNHVLDVFLFPAKPGTESHGSCYFSQGASGFLRLKLNAPTSTFRTKVLQGAPKIKPIWSCWLIGGDCLSSAFCKEFLVCFLLLLTPGASDAPCRTTRRGLSCPRPRFPCLDETPRSPTATACFFFFVERATPRGLFYLGSWPFPRTF